MKVDFLIVGAQKSGTSGLDAYLRLHDEIEMANHEQYLKCHNEIEMAELKEVHFFDNENNFITEVDYSKYHSSFDEQSCARIKGEATPIYMYWYGAPRRIWEYNSKMKLIAILRNPIERAFSHWNMERDRGFEDLSFSEAIRTEDSRRREALPLQHRVRSYIDRGFYTEQIRRLWHFFPKKQTLILKHDKLKLDVSNTLPQIAEFLDVRDFEVVHYKDVHCREYLCEMSEDDYSFLYTIFYHEIRALEAMLCWDCDDWLNRDPNTNK